MTGLSGLKGLDIQGMNISLDNSKKLFDAATTFAMRRDNSPAPMSGRTPLIYVPVPYEEMRLHA